MNDNGFLIPVFLSHSINDKQIAGKIKKKLSNFGVDKELSILFQLESLYF